MTGTREYYLPYRECPKCNERQLRDYTDQFGEVIGQECSNCDLWWEDADEGSNI